MLKSLRSWFKKVFSSRNAVNKKKEPVVALLTQDDTKEVLAKMDEMTLEVVVQRLRAQELLQQQLFNAVLRQGNQIKDLIEINYYLAGCIEQLIHFGSGAEMNSPQQQEEFFEIEPLESDITLLAHQKRTRKDKLN